MGGGPAGTDATGGVGTGAGVVGATLTWVTLIGATAIESPSGDEFAADGATGATEGIWAKAAAAAAQIEKAATARPRFRMTALWRNR